VTVRHGPRPITDRLRRLLVMLPWVMERGEVSLAEVAHQFELTEAEVERELTLAAMCGLPPYLDELVDVFIDEGMVYAGAPRLFTRPLRLTAPEGFALLVSGRAAMQLPGADPSGPLARALDKLAAVLGDDQAIVVEVDGDDVLGDLRAAAAASERVELRYFTPRTEAITGRTVTARQVALVRGRWYLVGDDERSGEERVFRVDRIEACRRTGRFAEPRPVTRDLDGDWFGDDDLPVVTVTVDAAAAWVAEAHPTRSVTDLPDGRRRLEMAVASERWFDDLLVRLGPHAVAVEPHQWRSRAVARATAVLARYDATGS